MPDNELHDRNITKRIGRNVFEKPPRVSVVIPAYKSAEFISECLDSVVNQKFREHEIIVVNDGSPDTEEFETAIFLHRENIIYIKQKNAGAGAARNTAIEHARGEIIAFLDADDVWLPDFLASQLVFLERHAYDMVYCDAHLFGLQSAYRRTFMETAPSNGEADFESILDLKCNVITSGTMVRKKTLLEANCFEHERVRAHDFMLWLRIAKNGAKIGYQKKQLLKYRVRLDSLSGDSIARVERERDAFERVAKNFELTEHQKSIVQRRIAGLEADLYVEQGKAHLLSGNFREAERSFRSANRYRRSPKLALVSLLTRIAPKTLVNFYRSNRQAEIALIPRQNNEIKQAKG